MSFKPEELGMPDFACLTEHKRDLLISHVDEVWELMIEAAYFADKVSSKIFEKHEHLLEWVRMIEEQSNG